MTSRSGNDAGEPPIDRDALRAQLAEMEPREKKIVGGMLAVMFKNPDRVTDREWVTEQFVHVASTSPTC